MQKNNLKLNLGCGQRKIDGFIGVDSNLNVTADIAHDLNKFPYPFADNSVDEIIMDHVLEHLNDPIKIIIELYRISKDGAKIKIKAPHFSCNWLHPGHKSAISTMLFDYFNPESNDYYGRCNFKVLKKELHWLRPRNNHGKIANTISKTVNFFANLHIGFCQRVWCYWVGGFEEVEFECKAYKNN